MGGWRSWKGRRGGEVKRKGWDGMEKERGRGKKEGVETGWRREW